MKLPQSNLINLIARIDAKAKFVVIVELFPVPDSGVGFEPRPRPGRRRELAVAEGVADAVEGRRRVRRKPGSEDGVELLERPIHDPGRENQTSVARCQKITNFG